MPVATALAGGTIQRKRLAHGRMQQFNAELECLVQARAHEVIAIRDITIGG
jgi:hypothetical protein